MNELFLGLDVGTQGTKGLLVDAASQRVVARAAHPYGLIEGLAAGACEQHPDTWWDAVRAVVRELVSAPGVSARNIRALGVSGQQHGFVPLDAEGRVLRPAKLWCDTATAEEASELARRWGRPVPTGYTASKILWMKRHEPERFARLAHALLPHEWLNWRLTDAFGAEAGDASGTGFFDPEARAYRRDDCARLDERLAACLPPLLAPGTPAGRVTASAAGELGLEAGTLVATGGGDNMLSAIGSGATRPGVFVASLGTSGTVFTRSERPIVDPEGLIAPFCDSAGAWLPLLCVMNVTGVTAELCACFGLDARGRDDLERRAATVPPGSDGLLFVPYLAGERVPDLPHASGTLLGIRHGRLRPEILWRAALEGTSVSLGQGVARMRRLGLALASVRLVGGGSRSPLWCQILADVLGVPAERLAEPESAALGAALQALWTWRRERGDDAALDALVQPYVAPEGPPYEPDEGRMATYRALGERFTEAVGRLFRG